MKRYSDKLDADLQVSMEEKIAAYLFDGSFLEDNDEYRLTEEDAKQAGLDILYMVLEQFRPDLFEE